MSTFARQPQERASSNLTWLNTTPSEPIQGLHPLLHLQRTIGNRAVLRRLKAKTSKPIQPQAAPLLHVQHPMGNRAVLPRLKAKTSKPIQPQAAPRTRTTGVCGPDVTPQVSNAITGTVASFLGWGDERKQAACNRLVDYSPAAGGLAAWDILDLNRLNNRWIRDDYSPTCASPSGRIPCTQCECSVEVDNGCHYSGSVNYVIYGHMCKLCHDYYARLRSPRANDFTVGEMVEWINLYKSDSANYYPSLLWAMAGYGAWLPGSTTPSPDRPQCAPTCDTPNTHTPFEVRFGWWVIS